MREYLAEDAGLLAQDHAVRMARLGAYAKEHFEFIGQIVECRSAREFIPFLLSFLLSYH